MDHLATKSHTKSYQSFWRGHYQNAEFSISWTMFRVHNQTLPLAINIRCPNEVCFPLCLISLFASVDKSAYYV
ncbi:hypothetical protein DsansV1_C01g0006431 [Dioscorea sansibarensis]